MSFLIEVFDRNGGLKLATCPHCGQKYALHLTPMFEVPKVYRLSATKAFVRKAVEAK
jgi:hypothetical protein